MCGDEERTVPCNGKETVIEFCEISEVAKKRMNPEDIDHHESDLYLKVNDVSREIVNSIRPGAAHVETFISNTEPHVPWFDIWWAWHE